MDKKMTLVFKNFDNKYIIEKTITLKFDEEKYRELIEIAIEIDDTVEEVIRCIVEYNLLNKLDSKDLKQLVMDRYYNEFLFK
ncbi:hypothetical protein [uncultured Clostridium sp.]|jgi:hypothetical protein|uniref:hypothetical protein n=1 Tax=uncultured Clostridium sp. TaxID=59620 RepID=UPI002673F952|nr:hypothetical protein [uncultured Clostridium sp.]